MTTYAALVIWVWQESMLLLPEAIFVDICYEWNLYEWNLQKKKKV
jgi:hypothetical protein